MPDADVAAVSADTEELPLECINVVGANTSGGSIIRCVPRKFEVVEVPPQPILGTFDSGMTISTTSMCK